MGGSDYEHEQWVMGYERYDYPPLRVTVQSDWKWDGVNVCPHRIQISKAKTRWGLEIERLGKLVLVLVLGLVIDC
jgi:hypothetical protein